MAILVPGGAGYIGSHTVVELLNKGKEVVIIDDFSNSKPEVLDKIKKITGKDFKFYEMDYKNKEQLEKVFEENNIEAVMNFAGYKAVGESVQKPIDYYMNNITGCLVVLDVMKKYNVKKFIFSSSATVYGEPERIPLTEDCKTGGTTNPYGTTKLFIEQILKDLYTSDNTWDICILRYFNPVGAHESGLIGEEPQGIPNNLMPYIVRVANGTLKELSVFGNDYNTPDGTGVRDYIHVVDLAKGHISALEKLEKEGKGLFIYNLGTGTGYSVLDMVKAFEKSTGRDVPYKIAPRRAGDIATCYADPKKAKEELGWAAEKTLDDKKWADAWEICNTLLTLDSDTVGVVYIRNLLRDWLNQKVFPFKSQSPEEYYYVRKQLQDVVNQEIRRNFGRNVQKMELDFHIQTDSVNKSVGVINLVSSSDKKQKLEARRNELRAAVDTIAKSINPVSEHKINIRTEDNIKADVTWSYTTQVVNKKDVRDSILASIIDTIEREYMYIDKQSKTELVEPDGSLKYVRIPKLPTKRVYTFGWINKELSRQDSVIKYNDIMLVDFETSLGASWMPSLFIPGLGTYNQNARSNVISRAFPFFLFAGVSVFGFLWEKDIDHPRYEINDDMNMNPLYIKNIGYFLGYGGLGIAATIYLNDLVEGISNSVKNIERSKKIRERLAKQGPIAIELQDVIIR